MTCVNRNITIIKIMFISTRYISSREPTNYLSPNVYVIKKELSLFIMELLPSLHLYLQGTGDSGIHILPMGRLRTNQINKLFQENEAIYYSDYFPEYFQLHVPRKNTCRLYDLYRNPNELLGVDMEGKSRFSIRQLFKLFQEMKIILSHIS
jgi:hypothetical protein